MAEASMVYTTSFSPDQEAYATIATPGGFALYTRYDTATNTGYMMKYEPLTMMASIYKVTGLNAFTLLGSGSTNRPLTGYAPPFVAPTTPSTTINVLTQYGTTDAQVRAAVTAAASAGSKLYFPAATYTLNSRLILNGLTVYGDGPSTILSMTDRNSCSVILTGTNARIYNLKITNTNYTGTRLSTGDNCGVFVDHANGFNIEYVTVDGSPSAGILNWGGHGSATTYATIKYCNVTNTLADGIHNTNQASYVDVGYNKVGTNVGDDLLAVVSYSADPGLTTNIIMHDNDVGPQIFGRGITVVGGKDISILNNNINGTYGAGILLATETALSSYSVDNVRIDGNYMRNVSLSIHDANILISVAGNNTHVNRITGANNNGTALHRLVYTELLGTGTTAIDNTVQLAAGADASDGPTTGDVVRFRAQGTTLSAILNSTTTVASVTDSTYNRTGKIGLGMYEGTAIDDFGGGSGGGSGSSDTTAPTLQTIVALGQSLTVSYDELLDQTSIPSPSNFVFTVNGTPVTIDNVSVVGSDVILATQPIQFGQVFTLAYTSGTNKIRDLAQNNAASFGATSVVNATPATTLVRLAILRSNIVRVLGTKFVGSGGGV